MHQELSLTAFAVLLLLTLALARFIHSHLSTVSRERAAINSSKCAPPRLIPVQDPIIGLDFIWEALHSAFQSHPVEAIRDGLYWFATYGKTYGIYRWSWRTVTTCDPKNIQHMLATAFKDFELPQLRTEAMGGLFGQGIFVLPRHAWGPARALLRPSFTTQNMEPLAAIVERHLDVFVRNVKQKSSLQGKMWQGTVDLQPLFFGLTMDTATEFLMGTSTHMLERSLGTLATDPNDMDAEQFVSDYFTCCVEAVNYMQMGPLGRLRINLAAWTAKGRIERYVDRFVEKALKCAESVSPLALKTPSYGAHTNDFDDNSEVSDADTLSICSDTTTTSIEDNVPKPAYNLVQELARSTRDKAVLRHQILHILLAGRDTTASLLSNFFFVLARDERVWNKLRAEVDGHLGGRLPTQQDLNEMTYLKWCYKEVLRLYPVVPTNARDAVIDTTLPRGGGPDGSLPIFVRKGTPIMYSVYAMHRDTDVYGDDALEFRPERWETLRPGWAYLPFNGGPRICLGQRFAFIEACYVIVRIMQTFETMEPRDSNRWTELYSLAMCSRNGLKVAVTPREGVDV